MKQLFVSLLIVLVSSVSYGQRRSELRGISEVNCYGIDFSHVRIFDDRAGAERILEVIGDLNALLLKERSKYIRPLESELDLEVVRIDLEPTNQANRAVSLATAHHGDVYEPRAISPEQIAASVRGLRLDQTEGTGLVILAQTLDKGASRGTFVFVLFDLASRRPISVWTQTGRAGGFGTRNYRAGALYRAIKEIELIK